MTAPLMKAARTVRTATLVLAFATLVGLSAVQAFSAHYGRTTAAPVTDAAVVDGSLGAAIAEQEAEGKVCTERPTLTDTVLIQLAAGSPVRVVTFDHAIASPSIQVSSIRRYCV